jgi:hypothetical protein
VQHQQKKFARRVQHQQEKYEALLSQTLRLSIVASSAAECTALGWRPAAGHAERVPRMVDRDMRACTGERGGQLLAGVVIATRDRRREAP